MHDVLVVKTADYMDDGVRAADVLQKFVAQARTLAGALDKARNVHEFDDRRSLFVRLVHLSQLVQPCIRHRHHTHIGLDGAEGVVSALCPGIGDGVKQGALAHIGQSYDT